MWLPQLLQNEFQVQNTYPIICDKNYLKCRCIQVPVIWTWRVLTTVWFNLANELSLSSTEIEKQTSCSPGFYAWLQSIYSPPMLAVNLGNDRMTCVTLRLTLCWPIITVIWLLDNDFNYIKNRRNSRTKDTVWQIIFTDKTNIILHTQALATEVPGQIEKFAQIAIRVYK